MKITALVAAVSLLLASVVPAMAQSAGDGRGDPTRREQLSRDYVTLQFGESLRENAQLMTQQSLELMGDLSSEEGERYRRFFERNMPGMVIELMTAMGDALVPIYAEVYTEEQLEALVAFYSTPMGREINQITMQTAVAQSQAMEAVLVTFFTNWYVKVCNEFGCDDAGPSAASGRTSK
ncbi:MAG: DUF2059 domain-containing protein [Brevundimonas sp.]|jgi:hypothetical protein|uniref:DUF2059 domain-containing protein n=1 Tax=Brevundimonas sp. TaxID=1871086 RepID=UPI003919E119